MLTKTYYCLKPFLPRRLQLALRFHWAQVKRRRFRESWPIDRRAAQAPKGWNGWPERKRFALILTHDVDTAAGRDKCLELMEMEKRLGFRSSFNFVPKRYEVFDRLRKRLSDEGFEVGVHGLYHDGRLYESRPVFEERAREINRYLRQWRAVGFRSPSMHHNLQWLHELDIEYDASTFDTDPFEPQSDGVVTIYPFMVWDARRRNSYVELPYTLPQDHGLFVILKETNIDIWKEKLRWLADNGGMALINTHPDYMNFKGGPLGLDEYPAAFYQEFLTWVDGEFSGRYWHVLPKEVARFWKDYSLGVRSAGRGKASSSLSKIDPDDNDTPLF